MLLSFGLTLLVNITIRNILKSICTTAANVVRDFTGSRGYHVITKNVQIKMVPNQYEGRLPYDKKIEEKFQRKKAVPVDLEDLQHVEEEPLPAPSAQQQEPKAMLQPSVNPPLQIIQPSNQGTPQLIGEEDPQLQDVKNPLEPILKTSSINPSVPAEQTPSTDPSATVQVLNPEDVLNMLSEGRLLNIAGEIQGLRMRNRRRMKIKKPEVLDVENKF